MLTKLLSIVRAPILQAWAVASTFLLILLAALDATVADGRLLHEVFFSSGFTLWVFNGISLTLGLLLLDWQRLKPEAGLTTRALYIAAVGGLLALGFGLMMDGLE